MMVFGLTGGIGAGKSTVSNMIRNLYHYPIIDADQIAADVVAPGSEGLALIAEVFGKGMITSEGTMDRQLMGALIRKDPLAKKQLEAITHPAIEKQVERAITKHRKNDEQVVIYDCPLLFETQNDKFVDGILLVCVEEDIRLKRLMERDGIDEVTAKRKIAIQMSDGEKLRCAKAIGKPYGIIHNNGGLENLEVELRRVMGEMEKVLCL